MSWRRLIAIPESLIGRPTCWAIKQLIEHRVYITIALEPEIVAIISSLGLAIITCME